MSHLWKTWNTAAVTALSQLHFLVPLAHLLLPIFETPQISPGRLTERLQKAHSRVEQDSERPDADLEQHEEEEGNEES